MSPKASAHQLELIERLTNGSVRKIALGDAARWSAKAGAQYAVIDGASGSAPKGLVVKRQGQSLVIEVQDPAEQVTIEQFYEEPNVSFLPEGSLSGDALSGSAITAQSPVVGTAAGGEPIIWATSANTAGLSGLHLALGGLGLATLAAAGDGTGGGGNTAAPVVNTVNGTVVGGPVVSGNGLTVVVYQADGVTKLGEAKVNADGSFSIAVGSYLGVVIAKVVDADAGSDYLDETTEAGKDLNAELASTDVVRVPNSTLVMNINALTTLAHGKAVAAAAGAPLTAELVTTTNTAIADLFGVTNLQTTTVTTTNGGGFDSGDGLSPGEAYGAILAALSGADANNGGDSQQTIDDLLAGITLGDGGATLTEAAQAIVVDGATQLSNSTGVDLTDRVAGIVDTTGPAFTSSTTATARNENSGAGQLAYTAAATDPAGVSYSLKTGGDAALFSINASTGAVTLTGNPDHETKSSYSFTVVATDAAGNASEQAVTLNINDLDESAPTITSGSTAPALDENGGTSQMIYVVNSTDSGDVATGSTVYSLKPGGDAALLSINPSLGRVFLTNNPDHETKSSYSFTVVATDAAGNSSEQAVTLNINDLDESAPTITSGATATTLNENSGAGQLIYTATSTDVGDVSSGNTAYYFAGSGDAGSFDIDTNTGAVTLRGNPDHEEKSSYTFTVVATDAAGNSSQQTVTLNINDLDESAPTITSGFQATSLDENTGAGQVVYTATSTDTNDVATGSTSYSLKPGDDAALFSINASTGDVTLTGNPDHETQTNYTFTVVATDAAGNATERAVTLEINDLDESAPTITSGTTADSLNENFGAGQEVYTVTSTDFGDLVTGVTRYSLKTGGDAALFSIDADTGAVTLTGDPDHETKANYSFTVVATDAAGNASEQTVTLAINDLDEVAPTITSGATATAINENSGSGQVIYTVTSTDTGDVATGNTFYSLKPGGDESALSINFETGEVTLIRNPDYETKTSYSFTVTATDDAGNVSEQAVTLAINNLIDEIEPSLTSIAITGASGAQNDTLNAGDVLSVTVTMDEAVVVDTTGGTPRVALNMDGNTVYASYASGSNTSNLVFNYTVQPGDTALNGVSIDVSSVQLNGGTIRDLGGNAAMLSHPPVNSNGQNLVDTTVPSITSGNTATAINENSGAGQTVYTASATDASPLSYSLKAVGDHAALSINSSSGAVTLSGNPDFEAKTSYSFTVVATDAAGNATERAVTLAINDVDDTAPTVSSVALTSSSGAQGSRLNAGDTVTVTVNMSEATTVTGTPQVALNIGGSTAQANFVSGSGSTSLVFQYTVQAGVNDANGIGIGANALQLNGGTLRDAAGNNATLTHASVADNSSYLVDTVAPTLTASTPADNATAFAVDDNIVLTFGEVVQAGSGNIVISDGAGDTRTISVTDTTQVSISGSTVTINPSADLNGSSTYSVQMGSGVLNDQAGNAYAGISNSGTLNFSTAAAIAKNIVVFDLVEGVNSSHSGRTFSANTSYTIYIRVNSNNAVISTDGDGPGAADSWSRWSGGNNLGTDDRIVLVGTGSPVQTYMGAVNRLTTTNASITWRTAGNTYAGYLSRFGYMSRWDGSTSRNVQLWSDPWAGNPNGGSTINNVYLTNMPAGVLTSQGLK